jgi:hypothetical protein
MSQAGLEVFEYRQEETSAAVGRDIPRQFYRAARYVECDNYSICRGYKGHIYTVVYVRIRTHSSMYRHG